MELNKNARNQVIEAAKAELVKVEGLTQKELSSGFSFFQEKDRVAKLVNTGRLEINIQLPEEVELKLAEMNFSNWANNPRSGVRYYGVARPEAIELLIQNITPKAELISIPEEAELIPAESEAEQTAELVPAKPKRNRKKKAA